MSREKEFEDLLRRVARIEDILNNPRDGVIARLRQLESDIRWLNKIVQKIDSRLWWILGSIVVMGIISILVTLLS